MAENLKKTCELVSKDIIYLQPLHGHVSNVNMTDELAVRCIENKWLKESDFVKLPEGYKGKIKHPDILDESDLTVKKTRGKTNTEG